MFFGEAEYSNEAASKPLRLAVVYFSCEVQVDLYLVGLEVVGTWSVGLLVLVGVNLGVQGMVRRRRLPWFWIYLLLSSAFFA
jgi:hypothetical protein